MSQQQSIVRQPQKQVEIGPSIPQLTPQIMNQLNFIDLHDLIQQMSLQQQIMM